MPQDMNRDPADRSLSGMSWDKATSDSTQEDVAREGEEDVAREGEKASPQGAAYESIKEGARSLGEEAKERASRYIEGGKDAVTEHLDTFAQSIRRASDELSEKDQTMASQIIRQAAGGLESLSRSIGGSNFQDMINSVRSFGRSNPVAFIGGAVLAGLAIGRFARASSHPDDRDGASWNQDGSGSGSGGYRGGAGSRGGGDWRDSAGGGQGYTPSPFSGTSYPPGERSSFAPAIHGAADAPPRAQGYAGGGMASDPIQSSAPSSDTDASVTTSSHSGGAAQPGSISTGGNT